MCGLVLSGHVLSCFVWCGVVLCCVVLRGVARHVGDMLRHPCSFVACCCRAVVVVVGGFGVGVSVGVVVGVGVGGVGSLFVCVRSSFGLLVCLLVCSFVGLVVCLCAWTISARGCGQPACGPDEEEESLRRRWDKHGQVIPLQAPYFGVQHLHAPRQRQLSGGTIQVFSLKQAE